MRPTSPSYRLSRPLVALILVVSILQPCCWPDRAQAQPHTTAIRWGAKTLLRMVAKTVVRTAGPRNPALARTVDRIATTVDRLLSLSSLSEQVLGEPLEKIIVRNVLDSLDTISDRRQRQHLLTVWGDEHSEGRSGTRTAEENRQHIRECELCHSTLTAVLSNTGLHLPDYLEVIPPRGAVYFPRTGLMWTETDQAHLRWKGAVAYCRSFSLGGYNDWRLPSVEELRTLYRAGTNLQIAKEIKTSRTEFWTRDDFGDGKRYFIFTMSPEVEGRTPDWPRAYVSPGFFAKPVLCVRGPKMPQWMKENLGPIIVPSRRRW